MSLTGILVGERHNCQAQFNCKAYNKSRVTFNNWAVEYPPVSIFGEYKLVLGLEGHDIRSEKKSLRIQTRYVAQPGPPIRVPPTSGEDTCRRVPEQVQLMQHSPYDFGNGIHVDLQSGEYSIPRALWGLIKDLTRPTPPGLKVKLLSPKVTLPFRGTAGAAGYNISAANDVLIPPHGAVLIPTDLAMAFREGWYGKLDSRSILAWKAELDFKAGVIDSDYRGHVRVLSKNDTHGSYQVTPLDKIAQLILHHYCNGAVGQVETLEDTARGEARFSSRGSRALDPARPSLPTPAPPAATESGRRAPAAYSMDSPFGEGEWPTLDTPHRGSGRPPWAPLFRPHSVQSQLARACAVALVTHPHARAARADRKRAAVPGSLSQGRAVGEGRVPSSYRPCLGQAAGACCPYFLGRGECGRGSPSP